MNNIISLNEFKSKKENIPNNDILEDTKSLDGIIGHMYSEFMINPKDLESSNMIKSNIDMDINNYNDIIQCILSSKMNRIPRESR